MEITARPGTSDDFDGVTRLLRVAFHDNPEDTELSETDRLVFEPERSVVAVDGDSIVGHAGIFTRDLTVPGGAIPAAFVTMVAVASTHRRKGIASTLVRQQLRDARAAGEPVALLWASEGRIYQRFGYGLGSRRTSLDIDTREVRLRAPRPPHSRIRIGKPAELVPEMAAVYETERLSRPGFAGRPKQWWDHIVADPAARRGGSGPRQAVLHEGPSGVDGYALFRVRSQWNESGPNGHVTVSQLVANNPHAYREMWRYLMDIDLTRSVGLAFGAIDEPLFDMVDEPRRLGVRMTDGLWVRLLDVPAALAARRYAAPIDLVIEVDDDLIPENRGRYRLTGLSGGTHCVPTTDSPDVAMDVATLAALYLGGGSAGALAAADRIRELRSGAVAQTHAAFSWHRAPVGIEMF